MSEKPTSVKPRLVEQFVKFYRAGCSFRNFAVIVLIVPVTVFLLFGSAIATILMKIGDAGYWLNNHGFDIGIRRLK